jgi:hypothetical protein
VSAGKENLQWQADDQLPAQQRSQHVAGRHHHHQHRQQQQEHGCAPGDLASDSGSSSRDGDSSGSGSDSSTGMLRLAAERSARETAAEVATIAAMLNPARGDNSSSSSAARLDTGLGGQQAAAEPSSAAAVAGSSSSGSSPMAEVRRLLKEKAELLATGLYGREDAVIGQIDARVQALAELAAAG